VVILLPILLNAVLIEVATALIPAVAAKAIIATTSAYSIKSWPLSSFLSADLKFCIFT
jgi:hypothetical protein